MSVEIAPFGFLQDKRPVKRITMTNEAGTTISVLTYGATIQAFEYAGKDIVLGYDRITDYETANGSYIGATIGRIANRIADGRFVLNGETIQVACNEADKNGHLHGGYCGFDKKLWEYTVLDEDEPSVRLFTVSEDGEEQYPGRLEVSVTFTLRADDTLELAYAAKTDKDTVVNLTNHAYFNLNGFDGDNILNTQLRIAAEEYTPVNEKLIPTGDYAPVDGTPLDYRQGKTIGDGVNGVHPQVAMAGGIDHNFVLSHEKREITDVVWAYSPITGIRLTCSTDLPGLQVYSGNFLCENSGKAGLQWKKYQGFCLETQYFPDSVNQPNFPSVVLKAGETYTSCTRYRVSK